MGCLKNKIKTMWGLFKTSNCHICNEESICKVMGDLLIGQRFSEVSIDTFQSKFTALLGRE